MIAPRHFRSPRLFAGALAFSVAGCMGGQTGGEFSDKTPERPEVPPGEVAGDGCRERPEPIALADASRLGFSGADLLAFTFGTHRAPLHWAQSNGIVSFGPEQGESTIEMTVEYHGGEVRFVAPAQPSGSCRQEHLEIDVVVQLRTGGGALDERFDATLIAKEPWRAELSHRFELEGLSGSFFVTVPAATHRALPLDLSASFTSDDGFSGSLNGAVEQQVGSGPSGSVGMMYVPVAAWP